MTIKNDRWIQQESELDINPLIKPFHSASMSALPNGKKVPSFGLSSFGYDLSLGNKFTVFKSLTAGQVYAFINEGGGGVSQNCIVKKANANGVIDVCDFEPQLGEQIYDVEEIVMPPYGFMLGVTKEFINMRRNTIGICTGKSTIARSGLHVVVTPAEPGWSGYLTLEIQNMTALPVRLTSGMGITQIVFIEGDDPDISYADRGGKYQGQGYAPVLARQKD